MQASDRSFWDRVVAHWRQRVEHGSSLSVVLDERGVVVAASETLADLLGYAAGDIVGRPAVDFIHRADVERFTRCWAESRTADVQGFECRWRRRTGGDRWLSWYLTGNEVTGHVYASSVDVTSRKRQEALFRETESVARIGGWEFDVAANELYWTDETYRLHDTSPSEHSPDVESGLDFYAPTSRPLITEAFGRALEAGAPFDLKLDLVTKVGRSIHCRAKGHPIVEDGEVVRIYGVFQDISEEAKVEQALRESEDLLRSILRDMRAGLVAQHPDGSIFLSNQAALDILGLTEDQITGRTSMDEEWHSIHEDGSPFPGETHPAMVSLRTGESQTGVIMGVFRPRTRDRVWILIDSVVQKDDQGQILRVISSFIDVTERKQAEDAARASDAMFRAVYQNAGLGVLLRDVGSTQVECNPTFERMIGRASEEVRALAMRDLIHPADLQVSEQMQRRLLAGEVESYELERRFVRANGEQLWGHETVSLVRDSDGEARTIVEMIVDITDRKQMEAQLMLADRMASLGTMAAGVGHEINNPLTWISGNVTMALELLQDVESPETAESTAEIRQALEEAAVGASRVRTIVRDLRLFSRADDKPGATAKPNQIVESSSRMMRNELRHRTEFELDLGVVPPVLGDSPRIGQVFTNLLVNALHALPDRPKRENLIAVTTRHEPPYVVLAVRDNGQGIPPELRSRIFDPFFTTKDVGAGTGLGLSICHSLITRLGGRIELDSEVGRGSEFRVYLRPATESEAKASAPPAEPGPSESTRKRILCIDDEPSVGRMIARFLRKSHEVVVETNAARAIERLREGERYDAIVCDIMMPVMSGIEFFEQLEDLDSALARRCGFITGGVFTDRARAFAEGLPAVRVVRKPFPPNAIRTLIDYLVA